jgi:hypothetical protein
MRHNEITITRCANGYAVNMPGEVYDRGSRYAPEQSAADMFKEMMPALKEITRQIHADPVLEEIREANQARDPDPAPPEEPVMGKSADTYVFASWALVLVFLESLELE